MSAWMVAVSVLGVPLIVSLIYVGIAYSIHREDHLTPFPFNNRDYRCFWCNRHSWELWSADTCVCKRCHRIRERERDLGLRNG